MDFANFLDLFVGCVYLYLWGTTFYQFKSLVKFQRRSLDVQLYFSAKFYHSDHCAFGFNDAVNDFKLYLTKLKPQGDAQHLIKIETLILSGLLLKFLVLA